MIQIVELREKLIEFGRIVETKSIQGTPKRILELAQEVYPHDAGKTNANCENVQWNQEEYSPTHGWPCSIQNSSHVQHGLGSKLPRYITDNVKVLDHGKASFGSLRMARLQWAAFASGLAEIVVAAFQSSELLWHVKSRPLRNGPIWVPVAPEQLSKTRCGWPQGIKAPTKVCFFVSKMEFSTFN